MSRQRHKPNLLTGYLLNYWLCWWENGTHSSKFGVLNPNWDRQHHQHDTRKFLVNFLPGGWLFDLHFVLRSRQQGFLWSEVAA